MSRVTITEAAAGLYLAMHNLLKQVEAGCQPMDVDLMAAHQALAQADQLKVLRDLAYADSNDDRPRREDVADLQQGFESAGLELPSITAVQAEEKKWSLPL